MVRIHWGAQLTRKPPEASGCENEGWRREPSRLALSSTRLDKARGHELDKDGLWAGFPNE